MEHTLLLVLMGSTVLFTILSFIQAKVIALRFISGMFLIGTALVVLMPVMFVGFTSTGVSTYVTSAAGDPGRSGEIEVISLGFGLLGFFQFIYALILMLQLAFAPAHDNTPNPDGEAYV
jgi:hypothetical protein